MKRYWFWWERKYDIDVDATMDAIRLLSGKREWVIGEGNLPFEILAHAGRHLEASLKKYFHR